MDIETFTLPLIGNTKQSEIPSPEEYTYWKLRSNRVFTIDYEIDQDYSLIELSKAIMQLNFEEKDIPKEELKPIYILIHTYGGDIDQAFYFADMLISSRIPIVTVGLGAVMSAGFIIFLGGQRRYAFKHCQMLVHKGSAGFSGTAQEMEDFQANYKKQLNDMRTYILERTDIDEKVFNRNRNKDWYLRPNQLTEYHIVDKIIDNFDDITDDKEGKEDA